MLLVTWDDSGGPNLIRAFVASLSQCNSRRYIYETVKRRPRIPFPSMSPTRVAIVTGAAQGIGRAIALRLADDHLDVAVNDIASKTDQLQELVSQIQARGGRSLAVPADISNEDDVQKMIAKVVETFGGLDAV